MPEPSPAERVLADRGIPYAIHVHEEQSSVDDVRELLDFPLESSLKALVFQTPGGQPVMAVLPALARLDYGRLAAAASVRRSDLKPASEPVLRSLAMGPGAASPALGADQALVVFDSSAQGMGTVYCGTGVRVSTLEITAADLVGLHQSAIVADIAKS